MQQGGNESSSKKGKKERPQARDKTPSHVIVKGFLEGEVPKNTLNPYGRLRGFIPYPKRTTASKRLRGLHGGGKAPY